MCGIVFTTLAHVALTVFQKSASKADWNGSFRASVALDEYNPETSPCKYTSHKNCRGDLHMIWSLGFLISDSPFNLTAQPRQIQTGQDVSDSTGEAILYVADPFFFEDGGVWYVFSEVLDNNSQKGVIGFHFSRDHGITWSFGRFILVEPWHLSFPSVLAHQGEHYMLACATAGTKPPFELWLYEAINFPFQWRRKVRVLSGQTVGHLVDPMLHKHNGIWFLFVFDDGVELERVFVSQSIFGPYSEHPNSKQRLVRQSGRIFQDHHGVLWSFHHTGIEVQKVQIKVLTSDRLVYGITEPLLGPNPMLSWASAGMHTFSTAKLSEPDDRWITVVDGWWDDRRLLTHQCLEYGEKLCQKRGLTLSIEGDVLTKAHTLQQANNFVFLQLVNKAYIEMTQSWACHAPNGVLQQTLFVATDEISFEKVKDFAPHVVRQLYQSERNGVSYGQLDYFNLMLFRTKLVETLLLHSINVWIIESDAVWFSSPHPYLIHLRDMDVVAGQDGILTESIPEGGFLYLNATEKTKEMWIRLRVEFEQTLLELASQEQIGDAGSEMLMLPKHLKTVNWTFFPKDKFVSGLWYTNDEMRQYSDPVIIQNNWIIGNHEKVARAKKWGHWYLTLAFECAASTESGF